MLQYIPYQNNKSIRMNDDVALDVADYAVSAAGVMGADTTPAEVVLMGTQAARLVFTPQEVEKPRNEQAKLIASAASLLLGALSGNKRVSSALGLIASASIDLTIQD